MKFFKKLKRYAAMATGDFEKIFREFEVPACPRVVTELLNATKDPDVTIDRVAQILEVDPGLGSQLLRMVNSSLYGLPSTVTSIVRAVNLVGLKEIENLAVCYAVTRGLKDPKVSFFNLNHFIKTSFFRAIIAREVASFFDTEKEEAFTGGLMQDIAIPTLLTDWFDIYGPVFEDSMMSGKPLHELERKRFSWDHCEAGAWIAKKWELPDILVCAIGLHAREYKALKDLEVEKSAIGATALSARVPDPSIDLEEAPQLLFPYLEYGGEAGIDETTLKEIFERSRLILEELGSIIDGT